MEIKKKESYARVNSDFDSTVHMQPKTICLASIMATSGIRTKLYLDKAAMNIVAKHVPSNKDGARIAELDEHIYKELLWMHEPLTNFRRIGRGYAKKLQENRLF